MSYEIKHQVNQIFLPWGVFMNSRISAAASLCLLLAAVSIGCREPIEQRGLSLLERGQFQQVIDLLQPAVEEDPGNVKLNTLYGAALLRNGQASLAVWPLRRAYLKAEQPRPSGPMLVEALVTGGASREGIVVATELLEANPDDEMLLSLRATGHAANLDREGALADIDRLIAIAPDNPRSLETRANLLTELDRLDEAAEAITQLRELLESQNMPLEAMARFCGAEGEFLRKHGEIEEARLKFTACLAEYPGMPDVTTPTMEFYDSVGEHDQGVEMLIEQANTPEGKVKLRIQGFLAQVLNADGRNDEAEAVLMAFADKYPVPQSWLELADHYAALGDMSQAAFALEKAIKLQGGLAPGEPGFAYLMLSEDTRFAYADILIQLENFERVHEILRHIDEPADKLLIEARLKLAEGDPQGALDTYNEAFRLWPSNPGSRYLAAVAALRLGEFPTAYEMFQDSMRADPRATDAGLVLARMRFLSGQPIGAMESGGFYFRFNPESLETPRIMLLSAAALGIEKAVEGIRDGMIDMGEPGQAAADYSTALRIMEGNEKALAHLDSIEQLDEPGYAPALGAWLALMIETGKGEVALKRIQAASERNPTSAELQLVRGRALVDVVGDRAAAEAAFARAIELEPEHPSARAAMGRHRQQNGDLEGAVAAFDKAHELDPENPDYGFFAAEVLFDASQAERAEPRLRAHLKEHAWHGETAARLARLAVERGDSGPETLILARIGAEYARASRPFALDTLARIRLARDENSEGRAALAEALQLGNPLPSSLYLMARILVREGKKDEAILLLDQSLISGSFPEIQAARALRSKLEGPQENETS